MDAIVHATGKLSRDEEATLETTISTLESAGDATAGSLEAALGRMRSDRALDLDKQTKLLRALNHASAVGIGLGTLGFFVGGPLGIDPLMIAGGGVQLSSPLAAWITSGAAERLNNNYGTE